MKEKVKVLQLLDLDEPIGNQNVLVGTINDIRIWAKNLWKRDKEWVMDVLGSYWDNDNAGIIEEDFYNHLDFSDENLMKFLISIGYNVRELCEVPFDDFYDDKKPTQELIDEVLFQIKVDIAEGDLTALDELLKAMPIQRLIGYLPEK